MGAWMGQEVNNATESTMRDKDKGRGVERKTLRGKNQDRRIEEREREPGLLDWAEPTCLNHSLRFQVGIKILVQDR